MYASAIASADLEADPHGFVTSNFLDFSLVSGDRRRPHEDLAEYFAVDGSSYWLGVEGLNSALLDAFGDEYQGCSMSLTFGKSLDGSMRSSMLSRNYSIEFGTTGRCRMSTSLRTRATMRGFNAYSASPAPAAAESKSASEVQTTSGLMTTSSGGC